MQLPPDLSAGVSIAPPPSLDEAMPDPRAGYVWVSGYWDWVNGRYFWVSGRWFPERRGYHWLRHRWLLRDGRWHVLAGGWTANDIPELPESERWRSSTS